MVPFTALSLSLPLLLPPSPLSSSSSPPFLGANEASESQGSAVIQHWGDGGVSGITSHKGPRQTVVSCDNRVGEPLVGRSSPCSPAQWPSNQWACSRCGHCSYQPEPHSGEKGRGGKAFWMEGFCSNDLGRTSLCVAHKKKPFVLWFSHLSTRGAVNDHPYRMDS